MLQVHNITLALLIFYGSVFTDTDRSVDEEEQILTDLYQPRENVLNVNELSLILSSTTKELSKGEYKWKGHGWMLYDESIQKLFDQQKELINQVQMRELLPHLHRINILAANIESDTY